MTTTFNEILDEMTTFRGFTTFLGGLLLAVALGLTLVTLQTITTPAEAASVEAWQAQHNLAELAAVPVRLASAAAETARLCWTLANAGDTPARRAAGLALVAGWKTKQAAARLVAVAPEDKRRRARPQGRTADAGDGPDADADSETISPKGALAPLAPALVNAVERILQLASRAAMTGRTDLDLLRVLEAIGGEIRTAEYEYHGPPDYDDHSGDGPTPDDIPF